MFLVALITLEFLTVRNIISSENLRAKQLWTVPYINIL